MEKAPYPSYSYSSLHKLAFQGGKIPKVLKAWNEKQREFCLEKTWIETICKCDS